MRSVLNRLSNITFIGYQRVAFSSNQNPGIKIPPPPSGSEGFEYQFRPDEIKKIMDPKGFLDERDYPEYEGKDAINTAAQKEKVSSEEKVSQDADAYSKKPEDIKEVGFKVKGPEPTRFGDWERKGRVSDF